MLRSISVELLTYGSLRARGWSKNLISTFFPGSSPAQLFALPAVLRAEQSDLFHYSPRQLSPGELAYLKAEVEIDTTFTIKELRVNALATWSTRHPNTPPPKSKSRLDRIAVNHARHKLSNFHKFYGKVRPFSSQVARNIILAEIATAWPELAEEAYKQMCFSDALQR